MRFYFLLLIISSLFFSCTDESEKKRDDSLQKQAQLDSIRRADSILSKKRISCDAELCRIFGDSVDIEKIKTILAVNRNVNCFCELEGEYTKIGARIPIIKDFFKKKTRRYKYQSTPLQFATSIGDTLLMRLFLDAGADPNLADSGQYRPMQIALQNENEAAFNLLAAYGGNLRSCYIDPLFISEEWLKRCAGSGCNFNTGQTENVFSGIDPKTRLPVMKKNIRLPLHQTTDYEKLKIMLEAGARPNDTASGGKTFLHAIMEWGSEDEFDLAMKYQADIYAKDAEGKTPLHYAAMRDEPDLLKKILPLYDLKKAGIAIEDLILLAESVQKKSCADYLKKIK